MVKRVDPVGYIIGEHFRCGHEFPANAQMAMSRFTAQRGYAALGARVIDWRKTG